MPSPRTITKEIPQKYIMKTSLKKLKSFIKIYSINVRKKKERRNRGTKNTWDIWQTKNELAEIIPIISTITLNVNELNNLMKGRDCQMEF